MLKADLPRLIDRVSAMLDALPYVDPVNLDGAIAYRQAGRAALSRLQAEEKAAISSPGGTTVIRLGGVTASSTMGAGQALRNWRAAAQRKLAEAGS